MTEAYIGTRKGLFSYRDGDIEEVGFLGVPVTSVLADRRDGAVYAALDHGHFGVKLHRSDDGGEKWTEIGCPAYPERPADATDTSPITGEPVPWTTKLLWSLEQAHAEEDGALWAGTVPGGLFRSVDRGETWALVESLWYHPTRGRWGGGGYDFPGLHSISVDPRGPGRLAIGVSSAGTWRTDDGAETWEVGTGLRAAFMPPEQAYEPLAQDPHRLARCTAEPDVVWCQHHNGIFRSTDGTSTWSEITDVSPSTFGFAVAAHPTDPDTAWFVPAQVDEVRIPVDGRVVVTRTRDGGRTFETLGSGLPDRHAYHLVYRHGLDVDDSGERLLLGSTTGGLWASDDGGDSFRTVSDHLPPINVVRWV